MILNLPEKLNKHAWEKMMDQKMNSTVFVVVPSEPMNFPLSVRPSKEMGDRSRQRKQTFDLRTNYLRI